MADIWGQMVCDGGRVRVGKREGTAASVGVGDGVALITLGLGATTYDALSEDRLAPSRLGTWKHHGPQLALLPRHV